MIQLRTLRELDLFSSEIIVVVGRSEFRDVAHALGLNLKFVEVELPFGDHKAENGSLLSHLRQLVRTINSLNPQRIVVSRDDPRELIVAVFTDAAKILAFRPLGTNGRVRSFGPSPGSAKRSIYSDSHLIFSHLQRPIGKDAADKNLQSSSVNVQTPSVRAKKNRRRIVIATQAASPLRNLKPHDVTSLVASSDETEDFTVLAGKDTITFSGAIESVTAASKVEIVGPVSIPELLALIQNADIVITADSAPMHIAAFFGKPTVAVFGPGNIQRFTPPIARLELISKPGVRCRPCFDTCLFKRQRCWPNAAGTQMRTALDRLSSAGR